jgi:hypothetical protein
MTSATLTPDTITPETDSDGSVSGHTPEDAWSYIKQLNDLTRLFATAADTARYLHFDKTYEGDHSLRETFWCALEECGIGPDDHPQITRVLAGLLSAISRDA